MLSFILIVFLSLYISFLYLPAIKYKRSWQILGLKERKKLLFGHILGSRLGWELFNTSLYHLWLISLDRTTHCFGYTLQYFKFAATTDRHVTSHVPPYRRRSTAYTAAKAVEVCLGQANLTNPIPLQFFIKFRIILLLDWLQPRGKTAQ